MWGYHYGGMHMFWWFFWIAVMIGCMYWLRASRPRRRDGAVEALRRSYATGTITEDEYRHRMEVLTRPKAPERVGRAPDEAGTGRA